MSILAAVAAAKAGGDLDQVVSAIPYLRYLGLVLRRTDDGILCMLPGDARLIGNPRLPALHGGVVGALLESAAIVQLMWQSEVAGLPKTINVAVDYLRSARPVETFAQGVVTKQGRRIANVRVEAWQDERSRPVAAAHAHFLLPQPEAVGTAERE